MVSPLEIGSIISVRIKNYSDYNSNSPYQYAYVIQSSPLLIRWFYSYYDILGEKLITEEQLIKEGFTKTDYALSTTGIQTIPITSIVKKFDKDGKDWVYDPDQREIRIENDAQEFIRTGDENSVWFKQSKIPFTLKQDWKDIQFKFFYGKPSIGFEQYNCYFCRQMIESSFTRTLVFDYETPEQAVGYACYACKTIHIPKLRSIFSRYGSSS
jgi:hypothetical protein